MLFDKTPVRFGFTIFRMKKSFLHNEYNGRPLADFFKIQLQILNRIHLSNARE